MGIWYKTLAHFVSSEEGPTAVEYAVMLSLIIAVLMGAIQALGQNTNATFSNATLSNALQNGSGSSSNTTPPVVHHGG